MGRPAAGPEPAGAGPRALALSARREGWRQRAFNALENAAGWLLAAAGFAAAVMMLELVFDPRYRSFPSAALAGAGAGVTCADRCGYHGARWPC